MDKSKTSSGTAPQPAPTPRVEKVHRAELNNLKNDRHHVANVAGKKK